MNIQLFRDYLGSRRWWAGMPVVGLALVSFVGAALRIYHLGFKSLWFDEAVIFVISNGNIGHVLKENAIQNSAPPLFALLTHAIITIGASEWILRAIPCLAGIAAIPLMYFLSRNFVQPRFAVFASMLVALSPSQIMYSQQLREYSLTFFLAELILYVFLLWVKRLDGLRLLLLGLVIVVSIFAQYGLAILILTINVLFLAGVFRLNQPLKRLGLWSTAQVVGLIAVYAVYQLSLKYHLTSGGFGAEYLGSGYWDGTLQHFFRIAALNTRDIFAFAYPMPYFLIICVLIGLLGAARGKKDSMNLMALGMLFLPIVITFVFALFSIYPYIGGRQTIFLTPMIYVFAAIGLSFLSSFKYSSYFTWLFIGFMVFLGIKETAAYHKYQGPENMRPIVRTLTASVYKDDQIYVYYAAQPAFRYYFEENDHPWIKGVESRKLPSEYFRQLDQILVKKTRVWLVFSHYYYPEWEMILEYVARWKRVWMVQCEEGSCLYLADY